jgi:3-carboxy-cis,cis-muconate cycloisomerase
VPESAACEISAACRAELFDAGELGRAARGADNPVVPLVAALQAQLPAQAAAHVHRGATSQDVLDSAAMLVATRALTPLSADLRGAGDACVRLIERHGDELVVARTLLQRALPSTFGLRVAGWLHGLDGAAADLRALRLPAQLGRAVGTLAALGDRGPAVAELLAQELRLAAPPLPWHTDRVPLGRLAGALGVTAGAAAKVARDLTLLAQTEVGEVAEGGHPGHGGSSTMPHKRNPVAAVAVLGCARRTPALVATLLAAMEQEQERAAGAWHAEWETLSQLLASTGSAIAWLRELLERLQVDPARMRANLGATGGTVMAESVVTALIPALGRAAAQRLVTAVVRQAAEEGHDVAAALRADEHVAAALPGDGIDAPLRPANYLGAAPELMRRAVALHARTWRAGEATA